MVGRVLKPLSKKEASKRSDHFVTNAFADEKTRIRNREVQTLREGVSEERQSQPKGSVLPVCEMHQASKTAAKYRKAGWV